MTLKYKNNAQTTLSAGINSSVTSIAVTDGSVFPTLTGIEYFYATFEDVSLNREVVKVTARSGNTLTVVRAQDGTTAQAFSSGDKAEGRLVAAMLADLSAPSYILSALLTVDGVGSGLDADLLDGLSSAAFGQLASVNTWTAQQNISPSAAAAALLVGSAIAYNAGVYIRGNAGQLRLVEFQTGASLRWRLTATATAESGSNAGTNFALAAYDDSGVSLGSAFDVTRATRIVNFPVNPTSGGSAIWNASNDGAGSGLDADLLDGNSSAYYLAASSYTAADVLSKLLTVDGVGSGLDADLFDGLSSAAYAQIAAANVFTAAQTINTNTAAVPSPGTTGVVLHLSGADGVSTRLWLDAYGAGTNYTARRANGTNAVKTALIATDVIMNNSAFGYDGTAYSTSSRGAYQIVASQNWAVGAHGTRLILATTPDNSTTQAHRWIVENDGSLMYSGATATGVSTVNALNYFVAGTNISSIYQTIAGYTAADVLAKLLTVDGAGSGLDADLWDGNNFATYIDQTLTTTSTPRFAWIHIGTDTDLRIYESSTNVMTLRAGGVGTETYVTIGASNTFTVSGYNIYHTANDGAGSGLDADLWDGNDFATYLNQAVLTTSAPTFAGATLTAGLAITSIAPSLVLLENDQGADLKRWDFLATAGTLLFRMVNDANSLATNLATITRTSTYTAATWNFASTTTLQHNSNTIWHAGNDGAGSGLDADLWDGNNFAAYLNQAVLTTSTPTFGGLNLTSATGFLPQATITNTNDDANAGYVIFYKSPADTLVTAADCLGTILWYGRGSSSTSGTAAIIYARAEGTRGTNWVAADLVLGSISTAGTYRYLALNAVGTMTWNSSTVWTAANDGAGSGLDADTLDSYNVGTSGATIPLLNANNTYSGISAFTGQVTMSRGAVPLQLTTTVDNGNVQGMIIEGDRATPTANDIIYMDWRLSNSAGTQVEFGRQDIVASTVTAASEASYWRWSVRNAGALTTVMRLSATALTPQTSDGIGLGSTALMWSDLFLASGGVVNFNNGDVTITHSADTLAFAGAATGYTFDGPMTLSSTAAGAPLTITSTEAGATAFTVDLFRNSASPAAADGLAAIRFRGRNSTPATVTYSSIQSNIADTTAASEDANLYLQTMMAGTLSNALTLAFNGVQHRFTGPSDIIVSAVGANGYGAFYAIGSATNTAYLFMGNATNGERSRIAAIDGRSMLFSNDGGVTSHFGISSTGVLTATGNTVWTAANDGAGSGLDADLLDGNNIGTSGSAIPLLSGTNTWGGVQTFARITAAAVGTGFGGTIHANCTDSYAIKMYFSDNGTARGYYGADATDMFKIYDSAGNLRVQFNNSTFALTLNGVAVPTVSSTDTLSNKTLAGFVTTGIPAIRFDNPYIEFRTAANVRNGYLQMINGAQILLQNEVSGGVIAFATTGGGGLQFNGVAIPTISSTDTLSNKTLTAPTINGGTIQSRVQTSSETTGTLTIASANKTIAMTGDVTMPNAVFTAGDMVTLDPGTAARTITRGASIQMLVNGVDSATATLAANQMGGAYWRSSSVCVLTGAVT